MAAVTDPHQKSATSPAGDFAAITPSDSLAMAVCRGIYVGVSGDITAVNLAGTAVLFKAAPVGILPIKAQRVNATGTTATNLVALY